jgi:hypothetical protein
MFRLVGGNLVAFSDVTKKATATIDLRQAEAVEDEDDVRAAATAALSPASAATASTGSSRFLDALDGAGPERSFKLLFADGSEIAFFTDSDAEKAQWLDVLRQIVGHIPQKPLWAELLYDRYVQANPGKQAASPQ